MGDCLYLRAPDFEDEAPRLLVMPSESWRHPEEVGAALAAERWINTTGVWVYSTTFSTSERGRCASGSVDRA